MRQSTKQGLDFEGFNSKNLDLLDRDAVTNFFLKHRPSVVILAAARVGGIGANSTYPVEFLSHNVLIQTNVMDAAFKAETKKLVFLGSSCIYPRSAPQPIKEEFLLTGPLEPTNSAYAIAKISGIELVKAYRRQYDLRWISLMPTNLYGPNDNFDLSSSHVLPALIRRFAEGKASSSPRVTLWGTGKPRREFMHVDDLAAATFYALEHYDDDMPLNIGVGFDQTIEEVANLVKRCASYMGEIVWDTVKPDGVPRKVLDVSRMKKLGFTPKISLEEGIDATLHWFRKANGL